MKKRLCEICKAEIDTTRGFWFVCESCYEQAKKDPPKNKIEMKKYKNQGRSDAQMKTNYKLLFYSVLGLIITFLIIVITY